jgi:uncharacterized protein YfaS (alpha-2-macroglobulin family)
MTYRPIVLQMFPYGDAPTLWATFTDEDGTPTDPSSPVTFEVTDPNNVTTSYTGAQLSHPTPGVYGLPLVMKPQGSWTMRVYADQNTSQDYAWTVLETKNP